MSQNIKNFILFPVISAILTSCTAKFPKEIDDVINKCDSQIVYLAIIKSAKLRDVFPDSIFSKYYDQGTHNFFPDSNNQYKKFRQDIATYYESSPNKDAVIKILNLWCESNKFIDSLGSDDGEFPPEAVLYENRSTTYIIRKQFDPPYPGQDWASLSSWQLYETKVDFLKHVEKLFDTERQNLFAELAGIVSSHRTTN